MLRPPSVYWKITNTSSGFFAEARIPQKWSLVCSWVPITGKNGIVRSWMGCFFFWRPFILQIAERMEIYIWKIEKIDSWWKSKIEKKPSHGLLWDDLQETNLSVNKNCPRKRRSLYNFFLIAEATYIYRATCLEWPLQGLYRKVALGTPPEIYWW